MRITLISTFFKAKYDDGEVTPIYSANDSATIPSGYIITKKVWRPK